jgi:integrase/recombinase XerD
MRRDDGPALWISRFETRLTYDGLRAIVTRRANQAGILTPALHSFRSVFARALLRAGEDIFTLKELLGHASLIVLERYLKLSLRDIQEAHQRASPVDNVLR